MPYKFDEKQSIFYHSDWTTGVCFIEEEKINMNRFWLPFSELLWGKGVIVHCYTKWIKLCWANCLDCLLSKCSVFHQTYMAFGLKFWERSDQNFNPNALWHEIDNAKHYQLSNTLPASSLFEFLESTETILTVKSLYTVISWLFYCT